VERSVAWLGSFRGLLVRWEHRFDLYCSFCVIALPLICVRRPCPPCEYPAMPITTGAIGRYRLSCARTAEHSRERAAHLPA
jgi:hypothetical protein